MGHIQSTNAPKIEYRNIAGFPGYRIGSDGTVLTCIKIKRLKGKGNRGKTCWIYSEEWKQKKSAKRNKYGHQNLDLYLDNGLRQKKSVHRLVLEAFVGPCPDGMEACHNDGNPRNNRLDNLRWDTPSSNMQDKKKHGTNNHGEKNLSAKLTAEQVIQLRLIHVRGDSTNNAGKLAKKFGVDESTIRDAVYGRTWQDLPNAQKDPRTRLKSLLGTENEVGIQSRTHDRDQSRKNELARQSRMGTCLRHSFERI